MVEEFNDEFYQKYIPKTIVVEGIIKCYESGKTCYPTVTQAKKKRKQVESRYQAFYKIYHCSHCDQYHFSTVESKYLKNNHD